MDWIAIPFEKNPCFIQKIELMNKWVNLQSRPDTHMRTLAQSCALYEEALAACRCHSKGTTNQVQDSYAERPSCGRGGHFPS